MNCPVLLIQGDRDPYGTLGQLSRITERVRGPTHTVVLAWVGHDPFTEGAGTLIDAIVGFLNRLA